MSDDLPGREIPGHIEIAYSAIRVFANDGTVDVEELNFLLGLALKDNVIDDDEKRVLRNILKQAEETRLSAAAEARIREVRRKHGL